LTAGTAISNLKTMEIRLDSELEARLSQLAAEQGRDSESLVVEAVERMVKQNEWFMREVEKGLLLLTGASLSTTRTSGS
jgi:predicted transcriptional regulator